MVPYLDVAGVPVSLLNMELAYNEVCRYLSRRTGGYFIFRDMNGIVAANDDPELRKIHVNAAFVAPDGMPLVWLARYFGFSEVGRVYGPDFLIDFCDKSQDLGYRHFFYGSTNSTNAKLIDQLRQRFPRLNICGSYAPQLRSVSEDPCLEDVERILTAQADVVWIGLGTPKQEQWMSIHTALMPHCVLLGVGAAFDFHAKVKRQAPLWLRSSGFEWAFRLATEPRRLWRRYIIGIPRFLLLMATRGCRVPHSPSGE